ncbi:NAD(P)/FAD-dependent oxidoreductase [uncultured Enterovirga sp.]|uniref:NAD(P)/FAD-dependent oxidoreductase n=1 Tax=uncultured Enterovirga sp. TaxID=2026352 RepID=UPI0035CADB6A
MAARRLDPDVLIVGGGPAGSAAAISCAARGLRVVLVERDVFVGERPGESLHPGIEPLLGQLGLAGRLADVVGARHPGIWISWAGEPRFEPFGRDEAGPWLGYQVGRAAFDTLLLERAREAGAEIRQPCRVGEIARDPDGTWQVATGSGPVRCRYLIDASASARWLERKLGLASSICSPRLFARYGYARGTCPERDEAPWLESAPRGWSWTARVGAGLYGWVRLGVGAEPDRQPPPILAGLTPTGPARGADVTWQLSREPAGPGWLLVGDAGARLDPLSSHGMLKAVMSGMMAAHLASGILGGSMPAAAAEAEYRAWISGWFRTDAQELGRHYGFLGLAGFGVPVREPREFVPG